MAFSPSEAAACQVLVDLALTEDMGTGGDVTSRAVMPAERWGQALLVARSPGVLAGTGAVRMVCQAVDVRLKVEILTDDGKRLERGTRVAKLSGPVRNLLAAERTALNFVQRLSGVATLTRAFVDAVAKFPAKILDTRKTNPGWRLLDKYAVRQGGGLNHRTGLYDMILIKDNHLAGLGLADRAAQIQEALRRAKEYRANVDASLPIEIEVDSLEQLDVALACGPDFILLDNMSLDAMREAVNRRRRSQASVLLEASGGVNLATVAAIAATGVDRISIGALTHSAPALDLALDYEA
jgi:nicotinate-nucleotide pyrophosphorylase (carboxylating)